MKKFVLLYTLYLAIAFFLIDYEPMRKLLHIESFYNDLIAVSYTHLTLPTKA